MQRRCLMWIDIICVIMMDILLRVRSARTIIITTYIRIYMVLTIGLVIYAIVNWSQLYILKKSLRIARTHWSNCCLNLFRKSIIFFFRECSIYCIIMTRIIRNSWRYWRTTTNLHWDMSTNLLAQFLLII